MINHDPSTPLLEVRDLGVTFPRRAGLLSRDAQPVHAVQEVTFDLLRGTTLGVVGESGSGKSTLGRAIIGLVQPTTGVVRLNGIDTTHARGSDRLRLRRAMQFVFQDPGSSLNPRLRVGEIVAEPLIVHRVYNSLRNARADVCTLLERCGLRADAADRYPHEFSGGQRQRIAIARAIALRPELVICDEPTSALDVSVQAQILNLLGDLQRDLGMAYLFISHDMGVIAHVAHRVAVMHAGRIVELDDRERVLGSPRHEYTRSLLAAVPVADPRAAPRRPADSQAGA
ncbi:MAG: ABC transporter ATP-binding protein [Phycisphaerales bacterium]|nr:ABC transporter ATP-binding protein [Phycisphaerales bacterium]